MKIEPDFNKTYAIKKEINKERKKCSRFTGELQVMQIFEGVSRKL